MAIALSARNKLNQMAAGEDDEDEADEADEEDEEVPFGYAAMSDDDDGAREEETEGLSFLA